MITQFDELLLGWLLGLLSTPVAMYATAIVTRRRFKDVLKEELREVRYRLTASVYLQKKHLGQLDRTALQWIVSELNAYSESTERNNLIESINRLLELADEQLTALARQPRNPLGTKSIPRIVVPYLSSNLESIGLLCGDKQKELVNLLHYIEVINYKVDELADWNRLTFEVSSNENHTLAANNADVSIQAISDASRRAVDCIKNYFS